MFCHLLLLHKYLTHALRDASHQTAGRLQWQRALLEQSQFILAHVSVLALSLQQPILAGSHTPLESLSPDWGDNQPLCEHREQFPNFVLSFFCSISINRRFVELARAAARAKGYFYPIDKSVKLRANAKSSGFLFYFALLQKREVRPHGINANVRC